MQILNMNSTPTSRARLPEHLQDLALLLLRLWLAQEFLFAAWQKGRMGWMPPEWFLQLELPWPLTFLDSQFNWLAVSLGEWVFGLAVAVGYFTRSASVGLLFITAVAVYSVHFDLGWAGWRQIETEHGNGFKVPLMMGLMLLVLVSHGAGRWTMAGAFNRRAK